jgi:hypothetical protein
MFHPQDLSVAQITWACNVQNPRLWITRLAAQVIFGRPARTHNYCLTSGELDLIRVQSANHVWNSRIVWLDFSLIGQGRAQHAKTRLSNLTPLLEGAPVVSRPQNHKANNPDKYYENAKSSQKDFAHSFHVRL